jgi:hypothetical protein
MGSPFKIPSEITQAPGTFAAWAERINFLLKFARAFAATEGRAGVEAIISEKNVIIGLDAATRAKIAQAMELVDAVEYCFKTVPVSGAAKVTFIPGSVEGLIPTIGGTLINDPTPPELTVSTGYNYLDCTMNASTGAITAAAIANASSVPSNTSTHRYTPISSVLVSGTVVTVTGQFIRTSVSHRLCFGTSTWGQA